jgi:hypothetical protein
MQKKVTAIFFAVSLTIWVMKEDRLMSFLSFVVTELLRGL